MLHKGISSVDKKYQGQDVEFTPLQSASDVSHIHKDDTREKPNKRLTMI